ncbi:MAG: cadherin-like beta sandwich domain-containing protein [Spirochaetes bacterium]|nr:cadherin-like beta sandwich domain-containing protein [Spirochaetota bacterium]
MSRIFRLIVIAMLAPAFTACGTNEGKNLLLLALMHGGTVHEYSADLASLDISSGTLVFNSATTSYSVEVENSAEYLWVTPAAADASAAIEVEGVPVTSGTPSQDIDLVEGPNTVTITVTAEDGITTKTYTLTITRLTGASTNANLASLSMSAGALSPGFAEDTLTYCASVENAIGAITVTPTAAGVGATITINGDPVDSGFESSLIDLDAGQNIITILVTAQDGATTGTYTVIVARKFSTCTYESGLIDPGYASAIVYYPCETAVGPFAATTLTGGWTNTKEQMAWIGNHLATEGYIIIAMTPNNYSSWPLNNSYWTTAHNSGIAKLISENARTDGPVFGLVKTDALQIMGFSMGGGGALLASAIQGSAIKSTQAIAPYMASAYTLSAINSATIVHTGSADTVASPANAEAMYDSVPTGIDKAFVNYTGLDHFDWYGDTGDYRDRLLTYITGWMKVYLDENAYYQNQIDGSQDWFTEFIFSSGY